MSEFSLGIICGGPSLERGISLNSARSVMDHLHYIPTKIYFMSKSLEVYILSHKHLYSNTPEDFDFKLARNAQPLTEAQWVSDMKNLSMVMPLIHGQNGEDGVLQKFLEGHQIPFMGSSSQACERMFPKDLANRVMHKAGYPTLKVCEAKEDQWPSFLATHKKIVVKPKAGGSSIGVQVVDKKRDCELAIASIEGEALCEAYCNGLEFTVVVVVNQGNPVALIPTEIEIEKSGPGDSGIYDYRRKYLPTSNTRWHSPPRFTEEMTQRIRCRAESLFRLFDMQDFARLDGWVVGDEVIFSDLNPISGMEQNSFLFLQASRVGMTHQDILQHILEQSCKRQGIQPPKIPPLLCSQKVLPILMGGNSEERQVSLMSGTNTWLKLRQSPGLKPLPYFLDKSNRVWALPYTYALNHTVEEVYELLCQSSQICLSASSWVYIIRLALGLPRVDIQSLYPNCEGIDIDQFCKEHQGGYVFLGLHGGIGEDGRMQSLFKRYGISHNGSCDKVSQLGMDKYQFAKAVNQCGVAGVAALEKVHVGVNTIWDKFAAMTPVVLKPRYGGCSIGVAVIHHQEEYQAYVADIKEEEPYIAEPFIATDIFSLSSDGKNIYHKKITGWVELTLVVTEKNGVCKAHIPSHTVAKEDILSIEEKFQGGTGINITPPDCLGHAEIVWIQEVISQLANQLCIKNYARFDLFYKLGQKKIVVIEVNTLPALTPSTVLFQQLLENNFAQSPLGVLLELIGRHPINS